ncbi:hypothetical protein POM88_025166 [Heracleum sosnowskyi]|uniref:Transmembrane protein n=1 Tax=Heracleum sosnowskyi TaxID=360622 RepID=A0AAD8I4Q9_9APIA|nr:hypothetical protein POM88_025161 [Heracleum sosnowskyi]KAK1378419.1 hypothetical protein POM88_025163 [Heracleum sosnowskyi]KAK1378422.1 hypothetical protein POM88_025166 [Heracleum sosnowskyi]
MVGVMVVTCRGGDDGVDPVGGGGDDASEVDDDDGYEIPIDLFQFALNHRELVESKGNLLPVVVGMVVVVVIMVRRMYNHNRRRRRCDDNMRRLVVRVMVVGSRVWRSHNNDGGRGVLVLMVGLVMVVVVMRW